MAVVTFTYLLFAKTSHMAKLRSMMHESIIFPEGEAVNTRAQQYNLLYLP